MDQEKKDFIEEATKSEYLDFILEREVEKKARELTQRYKWIFSVILFFLVAIASIFGWQLSDITKKKDKLDSVLNKMTFESESFRENIKTKKEEIDNLFSYISKTNERQFNMNDQLLSFYDKKYEMLSEIVEKSLNNISDLSESTIGFTTANEKSLIKLQLEIKKVQDEFRKDKGVWQKDINEMKNISSVVYAYVERGNDRNPGTKEYKPAFVNLPFSDKILKITFNKKSTYMGETKVSGKDVEIKMKEVEICIKYPDEGTEKIKDKILILREREPAEIPNTNHMIEAKFIYLPPNPTFVIWPVIIPDFVILEITLNPSKLEIEKNVLKGDQYEQKKSKK